MWYALVKWFVKRFLISGLNTLLEKYKDDADKCREVLKLWISRLQTILLALSGFLVKLDDGRIDDDEVDAVVGSVEDIIKDW